MTSAPATASFCTEERDSMTIASTVSSFFELGGENGSIVSASSNLIIGNNKLRLRVVNDTTKRYKDILVELHDDNNCYEAIYDNQAIKDANVRKWGSLVASQVKSGASEIRCILAGENDSFSQPIQAFRILSLQDLKTTTTAQLSKMVTVMEPLANATLNRVLFLLQCVKKDGAKNVAASHADLATATTCTIGSNKSYPDTLKGDLSASVSSLSSSVGSLSSLSRQRNMASTDSFKLSKLRNATWATPPASYRPKTATRGTDRFFPRTVRAETPSLVKVPIRSGSQSTSTTTSSTGGGISLPPAVVKEVFPYHIVFDKGFQVLQVGNRLSKLIGEFSLLERHVYDILKLTGPIPKEGAWDWALLDSMADNIVFLEPVKGGSRAKIKGTIIEVSHAPRQVMLVLFPDVKNLAELSSMNLTMGDLPIHSCQRDAVLVGEHSASEVKLTHHLDQRHRDLINSMEKQIADRTQELADANRDLEQANETLAQHSARQLEHFACMSHEIRTPLNCIVGMTSLMMESIQEMTPAHAEAVKMINGSGELLRAVVDDVLDFARLSSGSFETVIRSADLQETLDTVVHSIAQRIREKNIILRTHYSPDLPRTIETDSRRLQQVCYNLLGNAGKFSKPGSFVDLTVRLIQKPSPEAGTASNEGKTIRFSVKDYGKGIRKEDFKKIFQPFSQASKETQHLYGGTGLGLSITSKLVERLGGTISVDSEEGKFAEFTVDLPFAGERVDTDALKEKLSTISFVLVEPGQESASDEHVLECSPFRPDVVSAYDLRVQKFTSCDNALSLPPAADRTHCAFLVHEDLYEPTSIEKFRASVGFHNCTVMTYGPNYKVAATQKHHFKSLSGLIPSMLLEVIAGKIAADREQQVVSQASQARNETASATISAGILSAEKDSSTLSAECTHADQNNLVKSPKDMKILYAEDNKVNQKVLRSVLKALDIVNVDIAENGKEAVERAAEKSYDLIFMDMQMPVMDGLEATKLITDRDKDAIVVFVTAHALEEFKTQAKGVGGKSFVSKPFRKEHIQKVLESFGFVV